MKHQHVLKNIASWICQEIGLAEQVSLVETFFEISFSIPWIHFSLFCVCCHLYWFIMSIERVKIRRSRNVIVRGRHFVQDSDRGQPEVMWSVYFTDNARNLGVVFNNNLTLETHFTNLSRELHYEFRRISQLSRFLTETLLKTLLLAFIMTRIDYCNSLFINLPDDSLKLSQRFQNRAAKMVWSP